MGSTRAVSASHITYDLYLRKSQEPDDRQVLSIPAQRRECLSKFSELSIGSCVEEAYSAKAPGRVQFDAMMKRVERGEVQGILAWHPDRLSRNSVDAGRIIYLLDTGKLKDLKFCSYTFENTPEGKWMLAMVMGQAKYQVDKLAVDVRRGNEEKYARGGITWKAPQGYRPNLAEHTIEPDPERFALVRRMWELLLTGSYTVPQICRLANDEWGYRTRKTSKQGGSPLAVSLLYLVFKNPLYCGLNIRPDGTIHQCTHQPMVSEVEFWKAQTILGRKGRTKPRTGIVSPFTDSLIRCGECGCAITVDRKKRTLKNGRIIPFEYYHCTKKRGPCSQGSVERKALEELVLQKIQRITVGKSWWSQSKRHLEEAAREDSAKHDFSVETKRRGTIASVSEELSRLAVMMRRDLIDEDEYVRQRNELLRERARFSPTANANEPQWLEPALTLLDFGYASHFWFSSGSPEDKKMILRSIGGSNLTMKDKKLNVQPVGPFKVLARQAGYSTWQAFAEDIRGFFESEEGRDWQVPKPPPEAMSGGGSETETA